MQSGPIAYLVSEYPKVSHTFIQREIAGVRRAGVNILTYSIREPQSDDLMGQAERTEHQSTFYVFKRLKSPVSLIASQFQLFTASPARYFRAFGVALRKRPAGIKSALFHLAYFAEAAILGRELLKNQVSHLHVHFANSGCTVGMLASELTGIPFSFTMHGPTEFFNVEKFALPEKLKRAEFVVCISDFCRSQLMLFAEKTDWDKLHIIHCAVELGLYKTDAIKAKDNVLFVGRMSGVKGAALLLNAVVSLRQNFPDITVTMIGDGPEKADLEAQSSELGLEPHVTFLGARSQQEVAKHMALATVFVLPSFAEGLPVVLMEALASATPVIATRVAGVAELVEDGVNGRLVMPGNQQQLNEALAQLLEDSNMRQMMGKNGRAIVDKVFNTKIETKKLSELLRRQPTD